MNGKNLLVGGVAVLSGLSVWGGASFVNPGPLYAVPGIPCAVNYTRLFDSYTPQNYLFDAVPSLGDAPVDRKPYPEIEAEKHLGRCYADCWEYVAATNEAGKRFVLTLNAWNDEAGLAASVTTTVEVVRAAAPETVVAVCSSMGGSLDQDSWGHNSYCWNSAVLANKSFLDYNRRMKAYIDSLGDDRLVFVPITQNVDHLKAYPLGRKSGNAMHATFRGGEQLGDALFAWLLHDIEERKW